jgi:hypothetical protein
MAVVVLLVRVVVEDLLVDVAELTLPLLVIVLLVNYATSMVIQCLNAGITLMRISFQLNLMVLLSLLIEILQILHLKELLHVPAITKNLLPVSKFGADNDVFFEFHALDCYVKSQVDKQVILKGSLGADGLYSFHHQPLLKDPMCLTSFALSLLAQSATNKSPSAATSDIESVHSSMSLPLSKNKDVASFTNSSS